MRIEEHKPGTLADSFRLPQIHQGELVFVDKPIGVVADDSELVFVARYGRLMWVGMSQDSSFSWDQCNAIRACGSDAILISGMLMLARAAEYFPLLQNSIKIELASYETARVIVDKDVLRFSIWEILTPVYSTILRPINFSNDMFIL